MCKDIAETIREKYAILKAAKEQRALAQGVCDKAQDELERVTKISDTALSEFRLLVSQHAGVYSLGPGHVLVVQKNMLDLVCGGFVWDEREVL